METRDTTTRRPGRTNVHAHPSKSPATSCSCSIPSTGRSSVTTTSSSDTHLAVCRAPCTDDVSRHLLPACRVAVRALVPVGHTASPCCLHPVDNARANVMPAVRPSGCRTCTLLPVGVMYFTYGIWVADEFIVGASCLWSIVGACIHLHACTFQFIIWRQALKYTYYVVK